MSKRRILGTSALVVAILRLVTCAQPTSLPPGFQKTTLVLGVNLPVKLAFTPDGRLLIASHDGVIRVFQNGAVLPVPLLAVNVLPVGGERGLYGIVLDPDFAANGFLYVHYCTPEPRNRVSRFSVNGNTADPATEYLVWQNAQTAGPYHQGGGLTFGSDGNLYIATGDQYSSTTAQDLSNHHGKLLRVRPDGSIPPDNPFLSQPSVQPEIFASGLRNPYRIVADPPTGTIWIGNVGGNGNDSYEELNRAAPGANFGWPFQEGQTCYTSACAAYTFPVWSYRHDDAGYFAGLPQGSITAGPVYRATAFPAAYQGNLFVGDFASRWIRRLVLDASGAVTADPVFLAAPEAGTIVDLVVGPDGALYCVTVGIPWGGLADVGAVFKIAYTGSSNQPPLVVASAAPEAGLPPHTVSFSSAGTNDPDNGPLPLAFSWMFGDGATSTAPDPTHTYTASGLYTALLTVTDGANMTTSAPIAIAVGNPPSASITVPGAGTRYVAGATIAFAGAATDIEDGPLAPAALTFEVLLVHADHAHPFLGPLSGISQGSFTVPLSGHSPENTHFRIMLTATDSDGLVDTAVRDLYPVTSTLEIQTVPSGIPVFLDGEAESTPRTYESVVGHVHELTAQETYVLNGQMHAFSCWREGGARTKQVTAPQGGMNLTAHYTPVSVQTLDIPVAAPNRNAQYYPPIGQELTGVHEPLAFSIGRDVQGALQAGFEFALPVPPGATILTARILFTAGTSQSGYAESSIHIFDVADAPPFDAASSTPLTAHASLSPLNPIWIFQPFVPGAAVLSPEFAPLVQSIVGRPDWLSGGHVGFVFDGSPTPGFQWRSVASVGSATPPRLQIAYVLVPPPSPCPTACGFLSYGLNASPVNALGLVGMGPGSLGTVVSVVTTGLLGSPGAWTMLSGAPASYPAAGGLVLVDPAFAVATVFNPGGGATATWSGTIPNLSVLSGAHLYYQSATLDPSMPFGISLSAGLELVICP